MSGVIKIPNSLRIWFFVHFLVDYAFAIPIFLLPYQTLTFFGWQTADLIAARLFAAALFGIGGASFISRHSEAVVYKNFLILKIIFSFFAVIGFLLTILTASVPVFGWVALVIFAIFCLVWNYYYFTIF
jgi:hypothetical protein